MNLKHYIKPKDGQLNKLHKLTSYEGILRSLFLIPASNNFDFHISAQANGITFEICQFLTFSMHCQLHPI